MPENLRCSQNDDPFCWQQILTQTISPEKTVLYLTQSIHDKMKRLLLLYASIVWFVPAFSQLHCSDESMQRLQRELTHLQAQDFSGMSQGEIMAIIGKDFLGTPYVGKTLEIEGEPLVINLTGLDCTTFLENAVVLSRLSHQGRLNQQAFYEELQNLRYRSGNRNGYLSRLHYFSDWIVENEQKGLITQVSEELGGSPWQREINFMTEHADLYEYLDGEDMVSDLSEVEERLSSTGFHYLPKEELADLEGGIQDGDLIAITTSVNGLDIAHVGFAIRVEGRIHLFHASSSLKKVMISDEPLADYLAGNRTQTGIMVCRLVEAS